MNELYQRKSHLKLNYVYAVLFSLVFTAYPVHVLGSSGMLYAALYLLIFVILVDQAVLAVQKMRYGKQPSEGRNHRESWKRIFRPPAGLMVEFDYCDLCNNIVLWGKEIVY